MNKQLDSAALKQHKREGKLKAYLIQFTNEEKKLRKMLKIVSNNNMRSKLRKELNLVMEGYELLESNLRIRHP